jgi:phospholipid-binding lipoprotein MlaA
LWYSAYDLETMRAVAGRLDWREELIVRHADMRLSTVVAIVLSAFVFAGCATMPSDPEARAAYLEASDPLEPLNRAIFSFNIGLDKALLRPLAAAYNVVLPDPVRNGVRNFLNNLRAPIVFANDVLQGEIGRAGNTVGRFLLNSTLGVGGLFDVASELGFEFHDEDFGQSLAVWGIGEGPYLMLPILGPSNPRDAIGIAAEYLADPVVLWTNNTDREWILHTRTGVDAVDSRSRNVKTLEELERTSLDFYAAVRSLYRQRRMDEIRNGESGDPVGIPNITFDLNKSLDTLSSLE